MKQSGKIIRCASSVLEHAYFGNGSSLKFFVGKDAFVGVAADSSYFIPIYSKTLLAGWIGARCIGVIGAQLVFEATELHPAGFQVPSEAQILILA